MSHATLANIRRRRHLRTAIIGGLAGVGIAGVILGIGFSANSFFPIQTIALEVSPPRSTVSGASITASAHALIADGGYFRQNLLFFDSAALLRHIREKFPEIEHIMLSRSFAARTLALAITERAPWALWCRGDDCAYVDSDGIAFSRALELSGDLLLHISEKNADAFELGASVASPALIKIISGFVAAASPAVSPITSLDITPDGALWFTADAGWKILLDTATDPLVAAAHLSALLSGPLAGKQSALDYIDLRLPEKGFYKLR